MPKVAPTFTCENCGRTLPSDPTQTTEEMAAEFAADFGPGFDVEKDAAVVCDDCYEKLMKWARNG